MKELAFDIRRWHARGERVALATVTATRRSAPRPVGAKLAVSSGGELAGSVSGGCVENEVYAHTREVLAGAAPRLLSFGIADELALEVGLPCGGEIDVFVCEPRPDLLDTVLRAVERDERLVLFTAIDGPRTGEQWTGESDEQRSHVVEKPDESVFVDVLGPPHRLLVFGAVDTAEALCRAARELGWRAIVADPRARFATRERLPSADEILVAWPDEALTEVRPDARTAVVVLTHEDRFDIPALRGALASDAFYVGALGSRRNQARRRDLLLDEGVDEEALERLSGPCGLDIGALTPAETAVSILAEILAERAGREGGRLRDSSGRIHAEIAG